MSARILRKKAMVSSSPNAASRQRYGMTGMIQRSHRNDSDEIKIIKHTGNTNTIDVAEVRRRIIDHAPAIIISAPRIPILVSKGLLRYQASALKKPSEVALRW